mmetsp:Transcript_70792/g.156176  ORF Transcript_70792/g.156176 Transcript_70792/m.156176 type:complete len:253 (+) Transcript_70792:507-1265(+)
MLMQQSALLPQNLAMFFESVHDLTAHDFPDLHDGILHQGLQHHGVSFPKTRQVLTKLNIGNFARAVVVQHSEDGFHVFALDVHNVHELPEGVVLIISPQHLVQRQRTAAVCVHVVAKLGKIDHGLVSFHVFSFQLSFMIILACLCRTLNDNCQNQIHHSQRHRHKNNEQDWSCPWGLIDQWDGNLTPAISCHDLLKERHTGRCHTSEAHVTSLAASKGQAGDHRMKGFHRDHRPKADDGHQNHGAKYDSLEG